MLIKTFKVKENIEPAEVKNQTVQYLYNDGEKFFFMNPETFAQYDLLADMVGDSKDFMKEGENFEIQFYNDNPINLVLPKNVWLEVTYTENVVKGDTTSSVQKDAKLETGAVVKVPAFIKTGDVISVDTESYAYRERKK